MVQATVFQMADRVSQLLAERLGAGGDSLAARLRDARGRLPRAVREEAEILLGAAEAARLGRFGGDVDYARTAMAYDAVVRHLSALPKRPRYAVRALRSVLASLGVAGGLALLLLLWRGDL